MEDIAVQTVKRGRIIHDFEESHFGVYVVTGMQSGTDNSAEKRLGRVVQVRKEAGAWGSDIVFLRHSNGSLCTHENQCFYQVPDEFIAELDKFFDGVDDPNTEYTIGNENPYAGFIMPSNVKDGESTPMRDIKGRIFEKIDELMNK